MPGVRAREGEGCSNSPSEDEPRVYKRTRRAPRVFHYRNPASIIIQSTIETRGEEDAHSEEANGEQDHHHGEQEVEEGQKSEENDEDQEDVDILNVEAEGEQDHLISDLEAEGGQQSEEDQEDDDDLTVEVEGEQDYHQSEGEVEEGQQSEEDQEDNDELNVGVEGEQDYHQSDEEVEEGQQSEEHEVDQEDVDDSNVESEGEQDHNQSQQEVEESQQIEENEDHVYVNLNVVEELNNGILHEGDHEGHSSTSATMEASNIVITLTDPGLLDCPICCEPLTIPVFQCDQNGHIACSSCCTKINNKCPFCSCPIFSNRCRAIENVVESSTTSCQNSKYGCNIQMAYNKKYEHENACVCSPCSCPHVGCKFVSSTKELYRHFSNEHWISALSILFDNPRGNFPYQITLKKSDNFLVVREMRSDTLFVLHNRIEVLGNIVTVSCIQPSFMEDFNYELIVCNQVNPPSLQVDGPSPTSYLLIPSEFFNSCGQVRITVSIWCK